MKVQEQKEVLLTEEEFSQALRGYLESRDVRTDDYHGALSVFHEDEGWRLCFSAEQKELP